MPALPLAGPSGQLRGGAEVRRVIGWMPVATESASAKGGVQYYLKQAAGLRLLCNLGGPIQGLCAANGTLYASAKGQLSQVSSAWASTSLGQVANAPASMAANQTQLSCVAANNSYVLDFTTNTVSQVLNNWQGSVLVDVLDGYGVYSQPNSRQFYISNHEDFTALNALYFASAESSEGNVVGHIVRHRELLVMKQKTIEVWYDDPTATDFPLSRNSGANIEAGLSAPRSLAKVGGVAYWLGRDGNGEGIVFSMAGYAPVRVSNHALEEALSGISDLSGATAFAYHQEGLTYYVLNVPGLQTTWRYEVSSGMWHELAELVNGQYQPWRATCHAYAYGTHVVGDAQGNLYALDHSVSNNAGSPLLRDFISPHDALPTLKKQRFSSLQLDCRVGQGKSNGSQGLVLLRYSNDGGQNWSNWRQMTLGNVGRTLARARSTMLGSAIDRVWHLRVTDDVQCHPIAIVVNE